MATVNYRWESGPPMMYPADFETRLKKLEDTCERRSCVSGCFSFIAGVFVTLTVLFFWLFWWETDGFRKFAPPPLENTTELHKRMPAPLP
jgi:hypothetical protein